MTCPSSGLEAADWTLASPSGWYQDTASRLIYEKQDQAAVPELVKLLETSPAPLGRLRAMYSRLARSKEAISVVVVMVVPP